MLVVLDSGVADCEAISIWSFRGENSTGSWQLDTTQLPPESCRRHTPQAEPRVLLANLMDGDRFQAEPRIHFLAPGAKGYLAPGRGRSKCEGRSMAGMVLLQRMGFR